MSGYPKDFLIRLFHPDGSEVAHYIVKEYSFMTALEEAFHLHNTSSEAPYNRVEVREL